MCGYRERTSGTPLRIAIGSFVNPADGCQHGAIVARINQVTGEEVPVEPWVNQIHAEDWDWFERAWYEEDLFDYKIKCAVALEGAQ